MSARAEAARIAKHLAAAGVPDSPFEAELLTRAAAGLSRPRYFADPELTPSIRDRLDELAGRRAAREPFAYITGHREFFGLDFAVSTDTLIPRPETELLVEVALQELRSIPAAIVADIGTGSGAIAVSVAVKAPDATVIAVDVSPGALVVARENARCHGAAVQFVRANLAEPVRRADIILANLPYIPSTHIPGLQPEVRDWEPRLALDGGEDGLDLVRALIDDCAERIRPRLLALEIGLGQAAGIRKYGEERGARAEVLRDLAGIERVVCLRWP